MQSALIFELNADNLEFGQYNSQVVSSNSHQISETADQLLYSLYYYINYI